MTFEEIDCFTWLRYDPQITNAQKMDQQRTFKYSEIIREGMELD